MKHFPVRAAALAIAFFAAPAAGFAAPSPRPMPTPNLPKKPLHVQLQVEVNKRGQVVRVLHGDLSGDRPFDLMALGNAMQMWIRHPDGSAQTGLYRVKYDYDPQTHNVARVPTLVKTGRKLGQRARSRNADRQGIETRSAVGRKAPACRAARARQKKEAKNLPDINAAVRRAMAKPTPRP